MGNSVQVGGNKGSDLEHDHTVCNNSDIPEPVRAMLDDLAEVLVDEVMSKRAKGIAPRDVIRHYDAGDEFGGVVKLMREVA